MITDSEIKYLIDCIDKYINNYSKRFLLNNSRFDLLTDNISFLANERTISSFATFAIAKALGKIGFEVALVSSEFSIEMRRKLSMLEFESIRNVTSLKTRKKQWNKCYVDGYIQAKNVLKADEYTQIFIEYKMENKFAFLSLASDYLKYKTYTFKSDYNTAFVYVILKKEESYPSIMNHSVPEYELIDSDISTGSISGDKRVYIYKSLSTDSTYDICWLENAYSRVNYVANLSDIVIESLGESISKITASQFKYINNMYKFNTKVLKSWTLKQYYPFMKKVWDVSNNMGLFPDINVIFGCDKYEELTDDSIILEGANYKENLSSIITADSKIDALKKGVNGSTNVSLFIVSLCDFFMIDSKLA